MCIRCNVPEQPSSDPAGIFLEAFSASRDAMRRAAEAMDVVLRTDLDPEVRRRYDRAHKAMRRRMREWNAIEEMRESPEPSSKDRRRSREGTADAPAESG